MANNQTNRGHQGGTAQNNPAILPMIARKRRRQVAKAGRAQAATLPTTVSVPRRLAVKAGKTATAAVAVARTVNLK